MKWKFFPILALLALFALLVSLAPVVAASAPKAYSPWNDPRPYQGVMDQSLLHATVPQAIKDHPPHNRKRSAALPAPRPLDGDAGFYTNGATQYGVIAAVSAMGGWALTKPSINNVIIAYAPTNLPYAGCLEATVITYSNSGTNSTSHWLGLWDQCGDGAGGDGADGWQAYVTIDSTWAAKYLTQGSWSSVGHFGFTVTDKTSAVRLIRDTNNNLAGYNCWHAEIWNITTSSYDYMTGSCGTPDTIGGWSMFETYGYVPPNSGSSNLSPAYCTALGAWNLTQSRGLYKRTSFGGSWTPVISSDVYGSFVDPHPCYQGTGGSDNWHFSWNVDGSGGNWQVCGPSGGYQSVACRP